MTARLEDIANRVGVSRSEVSRVLNGRQRQGRSVGQAKQDEIFRIARELNYQPNRAAQNLARGRTDTVALMLQMEADTRELSPHYHEIIGAMTYTLDELGLHLLLAQSHDPTETLTQLSRSSLCDAVILTDMEVNDSRPALLQTLGMPFVIRGSSPYPDLIAVGMNNAQVGYRAVAYLHEWGHRRIVFHNIGRHLLAGERRYQGFCRAVAEFGLRETVQYEDVLFGEQGLYDLTIRLMREPDPPTAVFAADELAAYGVLRALGDLGLSVPDDCSVITCLNARFMRRLNPRLSYINTRQHEVATEASRTVGRLLKGEPVERTQTFLEPILEENGSCAAPRR